jgi:HK97 family phage portal protein
MTALEKVRAVMRSWFGPVNSSDPALAELFGVKPVSSGVSVTEEQALALTAVWACVQLIAGTLGSLPLLVYKRLPNGGKERMPQNPLYRLLHDQPNPEMTSTTFRETLQAHVLLWGNGFAEITTNGAGRPAALWPIEPWRVTAFRDGRALRYRVNNQNATDTILRPEQILHVPGLSGDGVWGYSVIRKAREAVGLGLATEKFGATFFGQGATFGGVLTHPARLSDPARDNLTKSINNRHQGVDRAHNFIILEEGIKYDRLGIPPEDAQFLETRKFQRAEIASLFGVPPHMIGDVERSTSWGTGIEAQSIGFVTYNLRRWLVRWEQELTRKLIASLEMNQQMIEFLVDGLLRGDTTTRYAAYNIGRNGGWFNADDIRELENMNPLPDGQGKLYLVPSNMTTPDLLANPPEPAPAPVPRPVVEAASFEALEAELRALTARIPVNGHEPEPPLDLTDLREGVALVNERVAAVQESLAAPPPEPPAPAYLTPILERLNAADAERRAVRTRLADLLPSVLALVERAAHDFVRREGDRARRAASSPEKLTAWMAGFYPRQADYGVKALGPAMQVYTALVGRPGETEQEIRTLVAGYVIESFDALTALAAAPPEDLAAAVDALATRWESDRPAALAHALIQEVITDAAV